MEVCGAGSAQLGVDKCMGAAAAECLPIAQASKERI